MVFKKKEKPELQVDEGINWATASSDNLLSGKDLDKLYDQGWVFVSGFKADSKFEYVFVKARSGTEQTKTEHQVSIGSQSVKVMASSQEEAERIVLNNLQGGEQK